ncbi:hypothetical protein EJ110_NYTH59753 [Nymphaea thermarum]|nr:hypothetical protein EJ110_NYTH59753 [Nymphaea thermarum]
MAATPIMVNKIPNIKSSAVTRDFRRPKSAANPFDGEAISLQHTGPENSGLKLLHIKFYKRSQQVEEELLNLQQGDQSLAQYFVSLKSIHERLKALHPPCPTCHKTHGEQSMVAKFLKGLSLEYAVAKAQMLTGVEIPDLAEAYNRLSRHAVTLSQSSSDMHVSALVASGRRGRNSFRGRGIVSSVVDGSLYPSHPETVTVSINKSEYEDFLAHRSIQPSASTVMIDSAMSVDIVPHDTGTTWIIDSGASRHFCSRPSMFTVLHSLPQPRHVKLTDGRWSPIMGYGNIQIFQSMIMCYMLLSFQQICYRLC